MLDALELGVQQAPNPRLDGLRISKDVDGNWPLLAVAGQPANPLVQTHRIPRHIDMDQRRTALLEINTLACRLGRHEEATLSSIERSRGGLTLPFARPRSASLVQYIVQPLVTVDKGGAAEAEAGLESVDYEGLRSLVFRKQKHRLTRWQFAIDEVDDRSDLGLDYYLVGQHDETRRDDQSRRR
ncbi:hypothetical protein QP162_22120 [Sphingomonas aurantiaca]